MNELKIYNIPSVVEEALAAVTVDEETGEITGSDRVDALITQAQDKVVSCAMYLKAREPQLAAMEELVKNLQARIKTEKKRQEWLKARIVDAMGYFGVTKVECLEVALSLRKSQAIKIDDETLVPEKFFIVKTTKTVDKTAVKNAIKSGADIQGARLVTNINLQIK